MNADSDLIYIKILKGIVIAVNNRGGFIWLQF